MVRLLRRPTARVVVAVGLIAVAYARSLQTLGAYLTYQDPLAYLGIVPLLALGVAFVKGRPRDGELRLPDRQVDWIVGLPLLAVAAFIGWVLPNHLSYLFWTYRLDLLGLPFFAGGVVALLLGSRVLYRVRWPLVALVLAWPWPYQSVIAPALSATTSFTVAAVNSALPLSGLARSLGGSVFVAGHGGHQLVLNVAPTCAGANTGLGFLLVGGAFISVLRGHILSKLGWLAVGVALMLVLNVGRILIVFWTAGSFGGSFAMGVVHPYLGLVIFAVGCAVMLLLAPRVGITFPPLAARRNPSDREAESGGGPIGGGQAPLSSGGPRSITFTALATVAALASGLGMANQALARFAPFAGLSEVGAVRPVSLTIPTVAGWGGAVYSEVPWASQYFGDGATWQRYEYTPVGPGRDFVFMEVVDSHDLGSFSQFGVEACYSFHGYHIIDTARADVGAADTATTLLYYDPSTRRYWSVLWWVAPVAFPSGKEFQRVVLLAPLTNAPTADRQTTRDELIGFARTVVSDTRPGATLNRTVR